MAARAQRIDLDIIRHIPLLSPTAIFQHNDTYQNDQAKTIKARANTFDRYPQNQSAQGMDNVCPRAYISGIKRLRGLLGWDPTQEIP